MSDAIDRKKTIERIKTDLSQYIYDDWGNITAFGTQLIYIIGCMPSFVPCKDYISREELIKDIKSQAERGGMTPFDEIAKSIIDVFISWVNDFPSVEVRLERQWIPCSERLPEPDTFVLTYHRHLSFDYQYVSSIDETTGEWSGFCGNLSDEVLAWMPLPKPYMEEVDG